MRLAAGAAKKTGFALDDGPANGCHRNYRLNNPDQLRLIRPAPQRPEPEPIDTLEAVGAISLMAFPAAR